MKRTAKSLEEMLGPIPETLQMETDLAFQISYGELTAYEYEIAGYDSLAIRTNGTGGRGRFEFFLHDSFILRLGGFGLCPRPGC